MSVSLIIPCFTEALTIIVSSFVALSLKPEEEADIERKKRTVYLVNYDHCKEVIGAKSKELKSRIVKMD